jgi:hypothetical protein
MITKDNSCPICFKVFDDPQSMPCKHIYCLNYLEQLYRNDLHWKDQFVLQCRTCFRRMDHEEYCDRMICDECSMDHRMEVKKNVLQNMHRYRCLRRRWDHHRRELMQTLENLDVHIECCADELIDQVWERNDEKKFLS